MSKPLKWAGTCRGQITSYALAEMDSGATAVNIVVRVDEYWDTVDNTWKDCREGDMETEGAIWIIKKDGNLNQSQNESLMQHANWDGDVRSIETNRWQPTPCSFVVSESTYKDESRYRISWLNDYDREPGASGNVSAERAEELQAQYGSQLRALAGNVTRNNQPAPEGKPPVPVPTVPTKIPPTQPGPVAGPAASDDDIPF